MASTSYQEIRDSMRQLYLDNPRPWLVGFSGGTDSTMVASLVFDVVLSVAPDQRKKPVTGRSDEWRIPNAESDNPQSQIGHHQLHDLPRVWVCNPIQFLSTGNGNGGKAKGDLWCRCVRTLEQGSNSN